MPVSLIIVFTEGDMNNKQKKIELNNCISYKFKSKQKQTTPQNVCASTCNITQNLSRTTLRHACRFGVFHTKKRMIVRRLPFVGHLIK